ncbi:hypothetical protein [Actinacidiphila oryziradicis]|uniref:hypothetical protein n=1 Tax=Actinacidiphila oryziradicis TaxID=2571141 RepID=UPI0023F47616|nr:hypothetical protein [Actinacidiphila oryziradicis]MCW2873472.1 putative integral rane protein [Actinacidiphila oryziradicis]
MGVESDQIVYDYLSRVGDLAQTALTAGQRAQLVAQLRTNIEQERGPGASATTVRRILGRLGSPDEVVKAAAGARGTQEPPPEPESPMVPLSKSSPKVDVPAPRSGEPQWWRVGDPASHGWQSGETVGLPPGMTGGLTIPLPDVSEDKEPEAARDPDGAEPDPDTDAEPEARRRRRLRVRLRRRKPESVYPAVAEKTAGRRSSPLELLGAASLVVGAILGAWVALALGWLIAYTSRRLSRREAKFAAVGLPGLVVGGTLVWLWGRMDGRWGRPIANGHLDTAIVASVPAMVRIAAVGSALFLLWRSRRPGG